MQQSVNWLAQADVMQKSTPIILLLLLLIGHSCSISKARYIVTANEHLALPSTCILDFPKEFNEYGAGAKISASSPQNR